MKRVYLLVLFVLKVCQITSLQPKIIIIGAGPAGIAAGTYLLEHNLTNIQILEAEPRIGGRIKSVEFGDAYVDIGAQWCHGEKNNIVYEKVKNLDLLEHEYGDYKLYHSSRKPIDERFAKELLNIMDEIQSHLNEDAPTYITTGEFCSEQYNKTIIERFGRDPEKYKIAVDALDYYNQQSLSTDGSFSWYDAAARTYYDWCEGDRALSWKGRGYRTILDVLMKKYPVLQNQLPIDEKIYLNKEVSTIIWYPNQKPGVICSDKSVYTADHVIFTASIGVLKENAYRMFVPSLPVNKINAVQTIGFGSAIKVWMYFSEPWWDSNSLFQMGFIWNSNDIQQAGREFTNGPQSGGRSWVTYMQDIMLDKRNPKVLCAWFTGYLVPAIEVLPEKTMTDGLYYVLNKFLGNKYKISIPDKILQSQWYSNPHFRGTYSFQTMQTCSKEGRCAEEDLAAPLLNFEGRPIIQFAGEATHSNYFSTVHGAIETGYREAKILVDLYNN